MLRTQNLTKNKAFKLYKNNRIGDNFSSLQILSQALSELITKRKEDYNHNLANILNNPQSSPKTFWKIFKTFYNGNKMPLIPPIIVNDKLALDYEEKANHFINSLLLNAHPLTMTLKFVTQLFSTDRQSFLPLLVKTIIALKLSEILTLAEIMLLMIYPSEWSRYVMVPLLTFINIPQLY